MRKQYLKELRNTWPLDKGLDGRRVNSEVAEQRKVEGKSHLHGIRIPFLILKTSQRTRYSIFARSITASLFLHKKIRFQE